MFAHGNDLCLGFWAKAWEQNLITVPDDARVLEIGCAEADWITPMRQLRPHWRITGMDVRACERPCEVITADALTHPFEADWFDLVVAVSSLEHFGLGAYGDPARVDADREMAAIIGRTVKPGGFVYFDVPFGETYHAGEKFRRYDETALQQRLIQPAGVSVVWRKTMTPDHPDAPYVAVLARREAQ